MIRHLRHLLSPSKCRTCNPPPRDERFDAELRKAQERTQANINALGALVARQRYHDGIRRRSS